MRGCEMESDSALDHRNTHSTLAQDRVATWLLGKPFTWASTVRASSSRHLDSTLPDLALVLRPRTFRSGRPVLGCRPASLPRRIHLPVPGGDLHLLDAGPDLGLGNSIAFYAFDSALVGAFGVVLALWSHRVFGLRLCPGCIGFAAFLYYYLGLDYRYAGNATGMPLFS